MSHSQPSANPYAPPPPPVNPYAPPTANVGVSFDDPGNAEHVRRQMLKHETSIRSIGLLYLLYFSFCVLGIFGMIVVSVGLGISQGLGSSGTLIAVIVLYGLLGWLMYYIGMGLRRLEKKVRNIVTLLSGLGLLAFPIGTLINGYILYLLHSEKGKRIMTPEYQEIVQQTPHIKYRTPLWLILFALLLIGSIVTLIVISV